MLTTGERIKQTYLITRHIPVDNPAKYGAIYLKYCRVARLTEIPGPFLGNGSVNMFLLLGSRFLIMQQLDYNKRRAVFYVIRAKLL
jgi:hypothetical protein